MPKLFSETVARLESAKRKKERGGDLDSTDIAAIRDTFHEESLDAKSLRYLIWTKTSLFVGGYEEKAEMAQTVLNDVRSLSGKVSREVVTVLFPTSWGSTFFAESLGYVEECESRTKPGTKVKIEETAFLEMVGRDFERARAAHEAVNVSVGDAIADVQWRIAYVANATGNPEELSKLAIERALLAGELRKSSEPIIETIRSDFEKLRIRSAKHGYKLSFVWD